MVPGPPSTLHPNMRGPETRAHCYQSAATQQTRSPIQGEKQGLQYNLPSLGLVEILFNFVRHACYLVAALIFRTYWVGYE